MDSRILVVDDEREIVELVSALLEGEGYTVIPCYDGDEAMRKIRQTSFDLAVLDIMLPGHDGYELCRALRKESACPIIMLTARDAEVDKVMGLSLGADDYISKPFLPLEFVARVKAQLRRYRNYGGEKRDESKEDVWSVRGLMVDGRRRVCTVNGREVSLTKTEFSILLELCRARGSVVSSDDLYYRVFGEEYYARGSGSIAVHIRHLREKMGRQRRWQGIRQDRMGMRVPSRLTIRQWARLLMCAEPFHGGLSGQSFLPPSSQGRLC